jgi:hypothetical protein
MGISEIDIKICPVCKNSFECKAGSMERCLCTTVTLSEDVRDYLRTRFDDCLCIECLKMSKAEHEKIGKSHS